MTTPQDNDQATAPEDDDPRSLTGNRIDEPMTVEEPLYAEDGEL